MFKKIKVLIMGVYIVTISIVSVSAMQERQNKSEIRQGNYIFEFKNTVNEYVNLISKKTNDFKTEWNQILRQFEAEKEISKENLENIALKYFEVAKDICLDEEKRINEKKIIEDLQGLNSNFYKYKLDKEDMNKIENAYIEQLDVIKVALKEFNEKHKEYEKILNEKISKKFYAKDRLKQFETMLKEKANEFGLKWESYIVQCTKIKNKLSESNIESFAFLYFKFEKDICLKEYSNFSNSELDEEKLHEFLVDFDKVFLEYKLDKKDKDMLRIAYKQQCRKIIEEVDLFKKMFFKYMGRLHQKIIDIKEENFLIEATNKIKIADEDGYIDKEKIRAYLEILEENAKTFQTIWNKLIPSFVNKEGIYGYEIDNFAAVYVLLADDIFLDEFGNVDEEKFLKKIKMYDGGVYNYKLTKEDVEKLKEAFNSKIILINGTLKTCFREFINFKACRKKLSEAINKKLSSNATIDFVENTFKNIMKGKIKTYLKAFSLASKRFKKCWNEALLKLDGKEEISKEELEKLVLILLELTKYIFLNVYGDVDRKNFRERLGTTYKNNSKFVNGFITIYTLDESDIQLLKEAFVAQIDVIKEALKEFYEKHIEYKDKLNAKINEELPLKIRVNIAGPKTKKPKKKKIKKGNAVLNQKAELEDFVATENEDMDVDEEEEEEEDDEDEDEDENKERIKRLKQI